MLAGIPGWLPLQHIAAALHHQQLKHVCMNIAPVALKLSAAAYCDSRTM